MIQYCRSMTYVGREAMYRTAEEYARVFPLQRPTPQLMVLSGQKGRGA